MVGMKNLKDVLEKLSIDDISLNEEKFPIDAEYEQIIEFLQNNNFKKISDNRLRGWSDVVSEICRNSKCYIVGDRDGNENFNFRIANLEKVPLTFFMYYNRDNETRYVISDILSARSSRDKKVSKEEWLREINKLF